MFQWILTKKWLPEIIFGVLASIIFGTFDFIGQGTSGLIVSLLFSATYFFFRQYTYVSAGLALAGAIASYSLGIQPTVAGFGTAGAIFLAGMFSNRLWGMVFVASNIAGGLHHAMPGAASGFCVYNDIAVGIQWLLDQGVERVAYVDVDVHHGDGVQAIFADEPRVLTVSLHGDPHFCTPFFTGHAHERGEGDGGGGVAVADWGLGHDF